MSSRARYIWLASIAVIGGILALGAWHESPGEDPNNQGGIALALLFFVVLLFIYVPVTMRGAQRWLLGRRRQVAIVAVVDKIRALEPSGMPKEQPQPPARCELCGGTEFGDVSSGMCHAILEDGGRDYWIEASVKCLRCDARYMGNYGPVDSSGEDTVQWQLEKKS